LRAWKSYRLFAGTGDVDRLSLSFLYAPAGPTASLGVTG
jgi:hypothetical protein